MGYPSGIITFTENTAVGQTIQPAYFNDPYNEIVAIETGLLNGFAHTIKFATDNTYNIGASGANRPANLYVANSIVLAGIQVVPKNIQSNYFSGTSSQNTITLLSSGIGSTSGITPIFTSSLKIWATFFVSCPTAGDGIQVTLYRSTVGVPAANASLGGGDGAVVAGSIVEVSLNNGFLPMTLSFVDSSVTMGTKYYYYLAYASSNSGVTVTVGNCSFTVEE